MDSGFRRNDGGGGGNDGYAKVSVKGEEVNRLPWEGCAKVSIKGEGGRWIPAFAGMTEGEGGMAGGDWLSALDPSTGSG